MKWPDEPLRLQAEIRHRVSSWRISEFFSVGEEEMSYGLRGRSYDGPGRPGGAETVLPVSGIDGGPKDPHDRHLALERRRVEAKMAEIIKLSADIEGLIIGRCTYLSPAEADKLARADFTEGRECARCAQIVKGEGRSDDRLYPANNGERVCFSCYRKDRRAI